MILKKGDMFDMWGRCDRFLVTANSYIKNNGELAMGRGAAKQLKEKVPESPAKLGLKILHLQEYGITLVDDPETYGRYGQAYGTFQVKRHYKEAADLALIEKSATMLARWMDDPAAQYDLCVLNFPGIGNGRLSREAVLPILDKHLGNRNNVWVYEYE